MRPVMNALLRYVAGTRPWLHATTLYRRNTGTRHPGAFIIKVCFFKRQESRVYIFAPISNWRWIYYRTGVPFVPRETRSPLGSSNIEEIYLDVTAIDDNHLKISIATGSTETPSRKRRRIIREEELLEEDELTKILLNFLPRDQKRRTIEVEFGTRLLTPLWIFLSKAF